MDWSHLARNCLVVEGNNEGRLEVKGRRGSRRKQLLGDIKETRRYWKLKEAALDRTVWRTRFGRFYGPVVRRHNEWSFTVVHTTVRQWRLSQSHSIPFTSFLIHLQLGLPAGLFRRKTFNCLAIHQFIVHVRQQYKIRRSTVTSSTMTQ